MYVNGATRIRGLTNHGGTGTGCGKSNVGGPNLWVLNDGKRLHNYGKSPFLMGKSTISMAIFNSFLYVYQRVNDGGYDFLKHGMERSSFQTKPCAPRIRLCMEQNWGSKETTNLITFGCTLW